MSGSKPVPVQDRPGTDRDLVVYPVEHAFPASEAQRHADFVARSRDLTCKVVAEEARARNMAVVVWIEPGGEYKAERVPRESLSRLMFGERIPDYLRRRSA
jgi:hypothetical protein